MYSLTTAPHTDRDGLSSKKLLLTTDEFSVTITLGSTECRALAAALGKAGRDVTLGSDCPITTHPQTPWATA